jgi:hypothetical protein
MYLLLVIFLLFYFNDFYSLVFFLDFSNLNLNFLLFAVYHYEGWIMVLSFIILISYIQSNISTLVDSSEESTNVVVSTLMFTLILKKLFLRKKYIDQLYFSKLLTLVFYSFQSCILNNFSFFLDYSRYQLDFYFFKKFKSLSISSTLLNINRIYII